MAREDFNDLLWFLALIGLTALTRALPLHQGGQEVGRPALARRHPLLAARQGQGLQPLPGLLVGPFGQLHGVHRLLLAHRRAALPGQQGHQGPQPLRLGHQRERARAGGGHIAQVRRAPGRYGL